MKKIMLLLCCSLIPWIARGQAAYDLYYWFDSGDAVKIGENSFGNSFSILTDADELSQGFHTIHVQVVDTAGVFSPPKTEYFYHTTNRSVVALRYWFDNDTEHMQKVSASGSNYVVDVSTLEPGLHYIYCQIEDASGSVSDVVRNSFYRQHRPTAMNWTYWFDETESTKTNIKYPGEAVMIDVSDLTDGFHTIHSQVQEITPSSVETRMFIKTPQTEGVGNMTCICTIDGNLVAQEEVPAQGGLMRWEMNVDSLDVGIHKAMFQTITPSGAASSIAERYFVREITNKELGSMKCVYSLDNFKTSAQAGSLSNGLFHFDLDVAALEDGLHRLAYMLVSENGVSTPQKTAFFWKIPLGGSGITQYDYWLNESKNVHSVTLDKRTNPFSLVKLLPVETEPIRSSCFQFEVKDGKPMLYAKNDFHIAFYDVTGRRVDESKQYVDYSTSAAITDITELKPTQTFTRLDNNNIKWFKFEAEEGDTIAFRANQATSLQVFAPSGKEIYATSGDKSVKYGGAHTWEDGIYYMAVHDVTGTKPNVTLDYFHMDRYDVVAQDVHVVGNGGCSTITFQGNGFRDLYAVELYTDQGDKIHSVDIAHESDASTTVTFDFTGAELGKYNALFHFTEEDKRFADIITVEEARDIELATSVTFPSTFLRGTSSTYTVKITNKGNMTAYMVPLEMKLFVDNIKNVKSVKFDGYLKSLTMPDLSELDSLDTEDIEDIRSIVENSNDLSQFIIYHDTIDSKDYGLSQIIMTLPPNATQTFTVSIKSTTNVHLEAWTTKDWFPLTMVNNSVRKAKSLRVPSRESMCCMKAKFECSAEIVANIAGAFMPPGAGCLSSLTLTGLETAYDVWCSEGNNASERWNNYLKSEGNSIANRLIQTAVTCVTGYYGARLKGLRKDRIMAALLESTSEVVRINAEIAACRAALRSAVRSIYDGITTTILGGQCYNAFTKHKPNCPPNPDGGGGGSSPVISYDPNDIYGYTHESGSKFVSDSIMNVYYRIEFENDTTFATSSAHVVEVKDTLDSKYFDLSTFAPTSVKIGDKVEYLDGTPNFVKTVDMRPAINTIAQVECKYDERKGIAIWTFTSLDPMTMEPTDDVMQGFLPVNYDGESGIGEVTYDVSLKGGFADGTEIPNRASIVFDINEPILTPSWVNTVDAVCPESHITNVIQQNDSIASIYFEGDDARSGVWKYELYVQYGEGSSWIKFAECGADSSHVDFHYYDGLDYGFCVLATDSAGNVEKKEFSREGTFVKVNCGDVNCDGEVNTLDASLTIGYYLEQPVYILTIAADVNGDGEINTLDATQITQMYLNANTASRANAMMTRQRLKVNRTTKQ